MREYLGHLLSVIGAEEELGVPFVEFPKADVVWLYDTWIIRDRVNWQYRSEISDILLV